MLLLYKALDDYSALTLNFFLAVYVLGLAPALIAAGPLSDRHGRRPLMLFGVACSIAASVCLGLGTFGAPGLYLGRFLSGIAVGTAVSVGASWLKELSGPTFDRRSQTTSGAQRTSVAFTLGAASGALVAGAIAQWTAWGEVLPFAIQVAIAVPFLALLSQVPETSGGRQAAAWPRSGLSARQRRRLLRTIVLAAPWLFAAAAIGYGYLPVLLDRATGRWSIGYATAAAVIALLAAAFAQPFSRRICRTSATRGMAVGLAVLACGLLLSAFACAAQSPMLGLLANLMLGIGIGIGLPSGLVEVQQIAAPGQLATLTGYFWAAAYCGFVLPVPIAALTPPLTTVGSFAGLGGLAALCCIALLCTQPADLTAGQSATSETDRPPSADDDPQRRCD